MHIPYVHMHGYVGGLCAGRSISIMPLCCLTLTVKVLELATCLSVSVAHREPVFMYKGEVYARYCTGKFVLFLAKRVHVCVLKVRRICMQLITAGRVQLT